MGKRRNRDLSSSGTENLGKANQTPRRPEGFTFETPPRSCRFGSFGHPDPYETRRRDVIWALFGVDFGILKRYPCDG